MITPSNGDAWGSEGFSEDQRLNIADWRGRHAAEDFYLAAGTFFFAAGTYYIAAGSIFILVSKFVIRNFLLP